ncbi:helix-turn-helix transcriptional regulator [Shewanella sp. 10N.286.54.B9]|uniref:AraC family transcriptional regulator n=1 Tax=Shewanella sp. 10N.286.54.B9 TaxID=3229719 RepID=UPI00354C7F49
MQNLKDVPNVEFRAPSIKMSGVEVLDLDTFYRKLSQCKFDPAKPHRINYFCFIYITDGSGGHFIDFKYHPFKKGSFISVNKNQVHAFDLDSRPQGKMINVTEDFFTSIQANIRLPLFSPAHLTRSYKSVFTLNSNSIETCNALLLEIVKAQTGEDCDPLLVQLLFSSLFVLLAPQRKENIQHLSETQALRFNHFLMLIETKFTETRDASAYAEMMHLSYKSLNQLCKLACNQTAKQLIDAHTILEIKRRLTIQSSQVQDIAYELGFDDVTYFVKFFKRHCFTTPSQFKCDFKTK